MRGKAGAITIFIKLSVQYFVAIHPRVLSDLPKRKEIPHQDKKDVTGITVHVLNQGPKNSMLDLTKHVYICGHSVPESVWTPPAVWYWSFFCVKWFNYLHSPRQEIRDFMYKVFCRGRGVKRLLNEADPPGFIKKISKEWEKYCILNHWPSGNM